MIDYKKAEQAKRLLDKSGVDYVLAYVNGQNCTAITSMHGDWQSIKKCVTDVMVKILKVSRRGGMMTYDAACELREMVSQAVAIHIERAKKEDENGEKFNPANRQNAGRGTGRKVQN